MATLDLVGQVLAEIDHKVVVTLTNLNVRKSTPVIVKKGALGVIGVAQGIPEVSGSFTLALPKTGVEINLEELGAKVGGFTLTYTSGANKYAVIGCVFSEDDITVDEGAGDVRANINFTGTERIRLS
jgi:hypothetical protein